MCTWSWKHHIFSPNRKHPEIGRGGNQQRKHLTIGGCQEGSRPNLENARFFLAIELFIKSRGRHSHTKNMCQEHLKKQKLPKETIYFRETIEQKQQKNTYENTFIWKNQLRKTCVTPSTFGSWESNKKRPGLGPSLKVFDAAEAWGNLILKKLEN